VGRTGGKEGYCQRDQPDGVPDDAGRRPVHEIADLWEREHQHKTADHRHHDVGLQEPPLFGCEDGREGDNDCDCEERPVGNEPDVEIPHHRTEL
jgi:hypothetical protein